MNEKTHDRTLLLIAVNVGLGLLLIYPFLHLVAAYWAYWDMGVNPGANGMVLLFLYAPVMLAAFTATAVCVPLVLRPAAKRATNKTRWAISVLSLFVVFAAAFLVEARMTAANRFDDQGVTDFLGNYCGRLLGGDFEPLRRRPN